MKTFKECCILKPRELGDGLRVSVMSLHTLNDGKTPDHRIDGMYDIWMPELSPGKKLVGSWYKGKISWEEFKNEYREKLNSMDCKFMIHLLKNRIIPKYETITVMCIEENPEECHRSILLEVLNQA